jgi:hypothetical protein
LKLSSNGSVSGGKKCKRGNGDACGGVWRSVCVGREYGINRREDVFTFNLVLKEVREFCTFNAICKNNVAKNYICI